MSTFSSSRGAANDSQTSGVGPMETTKPEKVEVGQRWLENDHGAIPYTVVAVKPGHAQIKFDDGQADGFWHATESILEDAFLGSASTPPAPARGQRWRDTTCNQIITLAERYKDFAWLTVKNTIWADRFFPGGDACRLQYVDSGAEGARKSESLTPPALPVQVGQRRKWTTYMATTCPFTAEKFEDTWAAVYDMPDGGRYVCAKGEMERDSVLLDSDTSEPKANKPKSEAGAVGPVMGAKKDGDPERCLTCGGPKRNGQRYICDKCPIGIDRWGHLADAWERGARDFPRPQTSASKPLVGSADASRVSKSAENLAPLPGAPGRASGPTAAAEPNPSRNNSVAAVGATRREVFAGGAWVEFSRLVDADPFESYSPRREDGIEVPMMATVVRTGVLDAYRARKREAPQARKEISSIPQLRAYFTPTLPDSATPGDPEGR